jgi:hypothetical protein
MGESLNTDEGARGLDALPDSSHVAQLAMYHAGVGYILMESRPRYTSIVNQAHCVLDAGELDIELVPGRVVVADR